MKNYLQINKIYGKAALAFFMSLFSVFVGHSQNVGINTSGTTPDVSAMLDIDVTNKGLLIPRIALSSITDATTIPTPKKSLLIYNTTVSGTLVEGYYYNSGTSGAPVWTKFATGALGSTILPLSTFGGEPLINSTSWQRITRTTYSDIASMLSTITIPAGCTRKYYLVIRKADNQPGGIGSYWRFSADGGWNGGNDVPGHGFTVGSDWGSLTEGTTHWIEIPPSAVSGSGAATQYWKLDARMANASQSMRVMSVSMAAVDVPNGTNIAYSAATSGNATNPIMSFNHENIWTSAGLVGLGTSAPLTKFHVATTTGINTFTGTARGILSIDAGAYTSGNYSNIDFLYSTGSSPVAKIGALFTNSGSTLTFGTSNNYGAGITNAAFTIDPAGNTKVSNAYFIVDHNKGAFVGIADQANAGALAICGNMSGGDAEVDFLNASPVVGSNRGFRFWNRSTTGAHTEICRMSSNGNMLTVSYSNFSDERLKTNMLPLKSSRLDGLMQIKGYTYNWDKTKMDEHKLSSDNFTHFGFKAQEIELIYPEIVYTDNEGIKSVNYTEMIPLLLEKIKELENRVKVLEETKK